MWFIPNLFLIVLKYYLAFFSYVNSKHEEFEFCVSTLMCSNDTIEYNEMKQNETK